MYQCWLKSVQWGRLSIWVKYTQLSFPCYTLYFISRSLLRMPYSREGSTNLHAYCLKRLCLDQRWLLRAALTRNCMQGYKILQTKLPVFAHEYWFSCQTNTLAYFWTVRDRRKLQLDHLHKIGVGEFNSDVSFVPACMPSSDRFWISAVMRQSKIVVTS